MASDELQASNTAHDDTKTNFPEQGNSRTSPSPQLEKGKAKENDPEEELDSEDEEEQEKSGDSPRSPATTTTEIDTGISGAQPWQAIYAPQYNNYYFYNNQTGETTWTNPLQPDQSTAVASGSSASPDPGQAEAESEDTPDATLQYNALQAAALAQGIDPSLAHLDPSLLTATTSASGGPIPTFQAKFNARTGAFTRPDARTPGHLSEYERMKRMSEFYFDVNAWEQQLADDKAEEEEGNGKKRKRPTKKDLERFKEQKRLKKIAKTAWLRT